MNQTKQQIKDHETPNGGGHGCGGCGAHGAGALLLDGPATAKALGIGLSLLYNLDRSGELGPAGIKLGSRRLWPRRELQAWVDHDCPRRERWETVWRDLRERANDS